MRGTHTGTVYVTNAKGTRFARQQRLGRKKVDKPTDKQLNNILRKMTGNKDADINKLREFYQKNRKERLKKQYEEQHKVGGSLYKTATEKLSGNGNRIISKTGNPEKPVQTIVQFNHTSTKSAKEKRLSELNDDEKLAQVSKGVKAKDLEKAGFDKTSAKAIEGIGQMHTYLDKKKDKPSKKDRLDKTTKKKSFQLEESTDSKTLEVKLDKFFNNGKEARLSTPIRVKNREFGDSESVHLSTYKKGNNYIIDDELSEYKGKTMKSAYDQLVKNYRQLDSSVSTTYEKFLNNLKKRLNKKK